MLIKFFFMLRQGGLKVSITEFLTLLEVLEKRIAGYSVDEFYYLACSHRLDLGYVDQPPFSIYILAFSRLLFGDSLFALRLVPAVIGSLTVFVTGLIVRKLSGGLVAMVIGCTAMIAAPILYL